MSEGEQGVRATGLPTVPYERIDVADAYRSSTPERVRDVMLNGWRHEEFGVLAIDADTPWATAASANRSWRFQLNAWTFLGPALATYHRSGDFAVLAWAAAGAASWARHFTEFVDDHDAWYDMAVGLRGHRLGYLIDALTASRGVDDAALEVLLASADEHFAAYATEALFADHSNHGLYFAAGQAALSRRLSSRPSASGHAEQAQGRLETVLSTQFADDGSHLEHSPAYHLMVLESTSGIMAAGLVESEAVRRRVEAAAEALAWFVTPERALVQFGDTARRDLVASDPGRWTGQAMRHVISRGEFGEAPTETSRTFPIGGYWVAKDRWWDAAPNARAPSYLALTAAFHSRVHKHADDLSISWWDWGHEILVDAGRYGYVGALDAKDPARLEGFFYSAPERQFVESTRAHNTVQVDDRDFPRRDATPYGSGIVLAQTVGAAQGVVAEVTHFGTITHTRVVVTVSGEWMLVYDKVRDLANDNHSFSQRFAFAPELAVDIVGEGLRARLRGGSVEVRVVSLDGAQPIVPVRGADNPLLGWVSRADRVLMPSTSSGFRHDDLAFTTFATLFTAGASDVAGRLERYAGPCGGDAVTIATAAARWRLFLGPFGTGDTPLTIVEEHLAHA